MAASVSAGIECAQLLRQQREPFLDTVTVLAQAIEMRDQYTGGHTLRVSTYSVLLAQHPGMTPAEVELIRTGTPLHDIGKIGIDDAILKKADRLTPEEFEEMKLYTVRGAEIIDTRPGLAGDQADRPQPPRALGRPRLPRPPVGRVDPGAGASGGAGGCV
jgi:HD-GYP domain-containing protein (c-di-GMP phosphodiesterase class II)